MKTSELIERFSNVDTSNFPDFHTCNTLLERTLWVLWVAKEELGIKMLTAEQIATIMVDIKETSIAARSITNSLNRAGDKIHTHLEADNVYFAIMKPGKDHLLSLSKGEILEAFYFEPEKKFTSRKVLRNNILPSLNGELRIVDPYCGERTLDTLETVKGRPVKFLTRVENLRDRERDKFLRELQDFKSENPNIEFRNYSDTDIHDRYIISCDSLVIVGHSIKDLGSKESFAIVLNEATSINIVQAVSDNFNMRWNRSSPL